MSNSIAPGSSADVNVKVTALTTNSNVPVTYKTIILKKNLVNGVNTLTQEMMSASNIKYVVKYDYMLGEDITVPENCIIEFDGGSLSNGNIAYNSTIIRNFNNSYNNIIASGTIKNNLLYPEYYGTNDAKSLSACFKYVNRSGTILINKELILFENVEIPHSSDTDNRIIVLGVGKDAKISTNGFHFIGKIDQSVPGGILFSNIKFEGTQNSYAFDCDHLIRISFSNCYITNYDKFLKCETSGCYFQTIIVDGCYCRHIGHLIFSSTSVNSYNIVVSNTTVEASSNFICFGNGIFGLIVRDCCIEGISGKTFEFKGYLFNVVIDSNYFEEDACIFDMSSLVLYGFLSCTFSNNIIIPGSYTTNPIIKLPNADINNTSILLSFRNTVVNLDSSNNTPFYYTTSTQANYIDDKDNVYKNTGLNFNLRKRYIPNYDDSPHKISVYFGDQGYSNHIIIPCKDRTPSLWGSFTITNIRDFTQPSAEVFEIQNLSELGFSLYCKDNTIREQLLNKNVLLFVKFNYD